jgi:adenine-specific DNA-methyltransferase
VLVVTIDEHEVHHLGMLLEWVFPEWARQMVSIVINAKGVAQGRFARAEEYALYCFAPSAGVVPHHDDLLNPEREGKRFTTPRWEWLLRGGTNSRREDRPGLFYPIFVDPDTRRITEIGEPLPLDQTPDLTAHPQRTVAWPIRTDGSWGNWRVGPISLRDLLAQGFVKLGGYDEQRGTWTVLYLGEKPRRQIEQGVIEIVARDSMAGAVEVQYTEREQRFPKTVWHRPLHDSGIYGSALLKTILGEGGRFSFPKSLYSTRDAIAAVVRDRPYALILDFFAGSGTTLHAVHLLNTSDGGQRRCILVTNNEVSAEEAEALRARGLQPGDDEWEAQGICRSVTWPRSKYTILGRRDDGSVLGGEYFTGKTVERDKARSFRHVGFIDPAALTAAAKKQIVALIDGLPQTLVTDPCPYIVSEDHSASVLFDPAAVDDWLEALDGQRQISDFVIVVPTKRQFDQLKAQVNELLGPLKVTEEEKRPMRDGFAANLAYFKLDFLDPERVSLRRAFREILSLLWLKAGAVGPRPELRRHEPEPALFAPEGSNFVVLLDETRMGRLLKAIGGRSGLSHVFIVTDADESFKTMAQDVREAAEKANPGLQVVQLYRDYLLNFMINQNQDQARASTVGQAASEGARTGGARP